MLMIVPMRPERPSAHKPDQFRVCFGVIVLLLLFL